MKRLWIVIVVVVITYLKGDYNVPPALFWGTIAILTVIWLRAVGALYTLARRLASKTVSLTMKGKHVLNATEQHIFMLTLSLTPRLFERQRRLTLSQDGSPSVMNI